jgi:hypothetical protein
MSLSPSSTGNLILWIINLWYILMSHIS